MSKRKHGNKIKNFFTFRSLSPLIRLSGLRITKFFLSTFLVSFSRFVWRKCDEKLYTSEAETRAFMQLSTWAMAAWICLMCCNFFLHLKHGNNPSTDRRTYKIFYARRIPWECEHTHREVEGRNEATLKISCIFVHARLHTLCCCWSWQPAHGMRIKRQTKKHLRSKVGRKKYSA